MGAHKGRKWADKPSKLRYHSSDRRTANKTRRILKHNGPKFLTAWERDLPELERRRARR